MLKRLLPLLFVMMPFAAQATCIDSNPTRAIILRDGGTILIDLEDGGQLRYDRRYGSPTRGQFFYEPSGKPERPMTHEEMKCLSQKLSKFPLDNGKEYYDTFVKDLNRKVKAPKKSTKQ